MSFGIGVEQGSANPDGQASMVVGVVRSGKKLAGCELEPIGSRWDFKREGSPTVNEH
jgi:hypothetical protein